MGHTVLCSELISGSVPRGLCTFSCKASTLHSILLDSGSNLNFFSNWMLLIYFSCLIAQILFKTTSNITWEMATFLCAWYQRKGIQDFVIECISHGLGVYDQFYRGVLFFKPYLVEGFTMMDNEAWQKISPYLLIELYKLYLFFCW